MNFSENGVFGDLDSLLQGRWRFGRYGINEARMQHSRRSREISVCSCSCHGNIRFEYPFSCISFCSRLFSSFNISSAGSCRYLTSSCPNLYTRSISIIIKYGSLHFSVYMPGIASRHLCDASYHSLRNNRSISFY